MVKRLGVPYAAGVCWLLAPFLAAGMPLPEAYAALYAVLSTPEPLLWVDWQRSHSVPRAAHLFRQLLAFHDPALAHSCADVVRPSARPPLRTHALSSSHSPSHPPSAGQRLVRCHAQRPTGECVGI